MAEGNETKSWKKALVRWGGLALLVASLVYLAKALEKLDLARLVAAMDWREWLLTAVLAVVYGAALGLLAKAWSAVAAPGRELSFKEVIGIYGPGAVAKYVPGSVLQYASRHVMGKRAALEHGAMAKASLVEAALHIAIALALAGGLLAGGGYWVAGVAGIGGIALALRPSQPLVACLAWQLMFFAVFAAIVLVLGSFAGDPGRLAGYFFIAWVAGFLVPVAPGGIGVREAVLLAIAARAEGADAAVLLALLARLVGIAGDGLFGLAGYFAAARLSNRQASG